MTYETLNFDIDQDGIATVWIDVPNRTMNVLNNALIDDLAAVIDRLVDDDSVKGVVLASAKESGFVAGADLTMVKRFDEEKPVADMFNDAWRSQAAFRKIETGGHAAKNLIKGQVFAKPFAAAINGAALGGGFELALACHHRLAASDRKVQVGQPEVQLGLIPGAGGSQRIMRRAGVQKAIEICSVGAPMTAEKAKAAGLIDEIVPLDELVSNAKAWCRANPQVRAPWDKPGFRIPGGSGSMDPRALQVLGGAIAMAQGQTNHNYPAVRRVLSSIYEGSIVPIDTALRIETKYFTKCLVEPQARNMIRTMFVNKNEAEKGAARPAGIPATPLNRIGVIGAGMMGAGIAYVAARSGLDVVLIDQTQEAAESGKAYSEKLNQKAVSRGKLSEERSQAMLSRIHPTSDFEHLRNVDLVIEAVFEDSAVKSDVIRRAEAVLSEETVFATNTSTLPIASLAGFSSRAQNFVGIHFFSPVDKMPLVEIIPHKGTKDKALAAAIDFVSKIRKTPIIVSDTRGFYCNSVVGPYINEAALMVQEGVHPALIDNAALFMGMPIGPLALLDETSQELAWSVTKAAMLEEGANYTPSGTEEMMKLLVEDLGRKGKKVGKGFYEYDSADGSKALWKGLAKHFPLKEEQPTAEQVTERLMYANLVPAARLLAQGIVHDPQSADLGAILGWGFCPWTGGPISHIDTIGLTEFIRVSDHLAQRYGDRFRPPDRFREIARSDQSLYSSYANAA